MPGPSCCPSRRSCSWPYRPSFRPGRGRSDRGVHAGAGVLGVPGRRVHASGHGLIGRATNGVQQQDDRDIGLPAGDQPRRRPSLLYGQRFTDGPTSGATPAIVLVHGIASSTENWDFSPTWSVARALASAGYVVFSYDRLGYANSSYYGQPGGGYTLTTQAHRAMLHDVVGDVKTGGYRSPRAATAQVRPHRRPRRTARS